MFECETCPYGRKDIKRRQEHLGILPEDYQIEYCHCDKVGGEHYVYGYCYENDDENIVRNGVRKSGRKYRIVKNNLKDQRLRNIINQGSGYAPHIGYIMEYFNDGEWICKNYISYPKNSNCQRFIKRTTSRKVRRTKNVGNYNKYRRLIDYWHIMY